MDRRDFLATLPALALLSACSNRREISPNPISVPAGSTEFALDLFGKLRETPGNLFFSPMSISIALAMVGRGAAGTSLAEMNNVLHMPLDAEKTHAEFGAFIRACGQTPENVTPELRIANGLWGQKGRDFNKEFLADLQKHYQANLKTVDFMQSAAVAREINDWVALQTRNKITHIVGPETFDANTGLELVNAVYFLGEWQEQFKASNTQERDFHVTPNRKVKAKLMNQWHTRFPFMVNEECSVLQMPYRGGHLAMLLVLPRKIDGLAELEKELSPKKLDEWTKALHSVELPVAIPKFHSESQFNLVPPLQALGMKSVFDVANADLSRVTASKPGLFVDSVIHRAVVDVDERGTEAAAVTAAKTETKSMIETIDPFIADHPFLYLIRDTQTGGILFMGRMNDPTT